MDQVKFFKSCLPQILLGPFLNTLTHMLLFTQQNSSSRLSFLLIFYSAKLDTLSTVILSIRNTASKVPKYGVFSGPYSVRMRENSAQMALHSKEFLELGKLPLMNKQKCLH